MSNLHKFVKGLEYGKRYYKPDGAEWSNLEFLIEYIHRGFRLHRMRGAMFCLKCSHCGSTDQ